MKTPRNIKKNENGRLLIAEIENYIGRSKIVNIVIRL